MVYLFSDNIKLIHCRHQSRCSGSESLSVFSDRTVGVGFCEFQESSLISLFSRVQRGETKGPTMDERRDMEAIMDLQLTYANPDLERIVIDLDLLQKICGDEVGRRLPLDGK